MSSVRPTPLLIPKIKSLPELFPTISLLCTSFTITRPFRPFIHCSTCKLLPHRATIHQYVLNTGALLPSVLSWSCCWSPPFGRPHNSRILSHPFITTMSGHYCFSVCSSFAYYSAPLTKSIILRATINNWSPPPLQPSRRL